VVISVSDLVYTVLLIDDTLTDREQYRRYLRTDTSCTYQFLEATSVAAGLELYQSAKAELTPTSRIDAILLDYSLPDNYGLVFLEALQAQNDDQAPPVIMATGSGDQRVAARAMKLGAADYLVKEDLTPGLLQRTVRSAIELAQSRRQLQDYHGRLEMMHGQMAQIWESMTDAYMTLGLDWRIAYTNKTAAQIILHLTQLEPLAFIGKIFWELFPELVGRGIEQEFTRAVAEQVPVHLELYYKPTGDWFEVHAYPSAIGLGLYFRDITDRKQSEAALDTSERKLRVIFNQASELMGLLSRDGVLLEVNQAALDSVGVYPSEIIGKNFWETPWWHTEELQQQLRSAIAAAAMGERIRYEVRFPDASGGWRITDFSLTPVIDEVGQVLSIIAEAHDITDRKQTEEALRQSEEFKQRMLESSQDCIKVLNLDGELLYMNMGGQCLLEIDDVTPYLNTAWLDFWESDDERQRASQALARAVSGEVGLFYGYFPTATGTPKWWEVMLSPILNGSQQVEQVLAISRDITDRKQAEQKLQESEERLRAGVQVAGVGLARFNYATHQVELSQEAAALYGFSPGTSTVSRAQIHATFHPDEREELEAIIAQVLDPMGTGWFARDHLVVWPNGEVRCLSVRKQVFFVQSESGMKPDYAILAAIDITERQKIQAELEERNRELDNFVYIVSHDLKAPLRGIANLSQWIEEDLQGALLPQTQEQMTLLRSRVNRMSATIDGLLDYARIGRTSETIELVSVAELLAETIDSLAPPPAFAIFVTPPLPIFKTNRLLLSQVFSNLISNGIKHHNRADGSINVSSEECGDFYRFVITDDGPGIAPEHHKKIFAIFQAVNPTKSSDSTGIGLSIVKKIVETSGGTIQIESTLGKGATFSFTWPKQS
jgi:PAS domain S-box-containing protein